jgi:hypothetical protein
MAALALADVSAAPMPPYLSLSALFSARLSCSISHSLLNPLAAAFASATSTSRAWRLGLDHLSLG